MTPNLRLCYGLARQVFGFLQKSSPALPGPTGIARRDLLQRRQFFLQCGIYFMILTHRFLPFLPSAAAAAVC